MDGEHTTSIKQRKPATHTVDDDDALLPEEQALNFYEERHPNRPLNTLQKHVLFWDRDCDGVIWPWQIFQGFRELGFGIVWSIGSLLIPVFFSYPTRLGHSWIPDPFFRIYVDTGNKSKHGSDSGIYSFDGNFSQSRFDEMFDYFDTTSTGSLSAEDLWHLWGRNRCAADPAGWSFAFMEWSTTWLLLQKDGRVWKDDLRACYEGTLFWKISKARSENGQGWKQGYGVADFCRGVWKGGTWRVWEIEQ